MEDNYQSPLSSCSSGVAEAAIGGSDELQNENESDPVSQQFQPTDSEEPNVSSATISSPVKPYARLEDFGHCEFADDADDVICDYFSTRVDLDESAISTQDELEHENADNSASLEPSTSSVAASTSQPSSSETPTDQRDITTFFETDCCPKKCNSRFRKELIIETRDAAIENDYRCPDHINHLHLILLGQLSSLTIDDDSVTPENRCSKEREKRRIQFMYQGIQTCKKFFQFVYNCGGRRLKNLKKQLRETGLEPRMHHRQGKPPTNVTDMEVVEAFKTFLTNFTDAHALVLPGKLPCYSGNDPSIRILPSSLTKVEVHRRFIESSSYRMQYRLFCLFWMKFFPNILIQKPRTDLCSECYKNTVSLGKLHGLSEDEKLALIKKSESHLNRVLEERNIYREATRRLEFQMELMKSVPLNFSGKMHYSFDFAQQIFLPFDSQQVGALYFLTPYKVSLFGVACEPLGKFVLYVIPESVGGVGKGANIVISLFHHFLENFGVGETEIFIHADNCSGQNKNNYLMQYAVWRTVVGLHKNFKISFLPVGHTKFAPDLYFGSVKRAYRRSSVHSLEGFKEMLEKSCGKHVIPFLVANENGEMHLKMYDWQTFFKDLKAERVQGLLENYHFECSVNLKGVMSHKKSIHEKEVNTQVFPADCNLMQEDMPNEIVVSGLPVIRKKYLFQKVREFVRDDCKDILCPEPTEQELQDISLSHSTKSKLSLPASSVLQPTVNETQEQVSDAPQNQSNIVECEKKSRKTTRCGYCQQEGHTNRLGKGGFPLCPKRKEDEREPNDSSN